MIDEAERKRPTVLKAGSRPAIPEPSSRFAGDGTGLMIVVIGMIVLLLIVGAAFVGWMAHRAFERFDRHEAARAQTHVAPSTASSGSMNPADWITADDYPAEALRNNDEGVVRIRWTVRPDGRVRACSVDDSSGHESLDRAACRAIVRNGRYPPVAAGAAGREFTRRIVWRIPG